MMMEDISLIIGIILSVLLIVSTGLWIWDRFKPKKSFFKCELIKIKKGLFRLDVYNLKNKQLTINEIKLNDRVRDKFVEDRKFPITIQPQNNLSFTFPVEPHKVPSICKITVPKIIGTKTLTYTI